MKLVLHNYWRSSASHRVRIGLHLKGLAFEYVAVNLVKREQDGDAFRAKNPLGRVPALDVHEDDGSVRSLTQSLPILEYLDERWRERPLLPREPYLRARARSIAEIVNSAIQPFQNLSTMAKVTALGGDATAWTRGWIAEGLIGLSAAVADVGGAFCVGDSPTLADCCLVPQLLGARRFGVDLTPHAQLLAIEERCLALPAFADAAPDRQPDAAS